MNLILKEPIHTVGHRFRRVVGRYKGNMPGPTLIAIAGLHGNEPTGVFAMEKVMARLNELSPEFSGEFIALAGNLKALERGVRYLDRDLNRIWFKSKKDNQLIFPSEIEEAEEFHEIWKIIDHAIDNRQGELIFLDMHTTSAQSAPFCLIGDTMRNRRFIDGFPVPIILGLEEQLDGPLMSYLNERGFITFGFEAGQHEARESEANHENMLWLTLEKAGCIKRENMPEYEHAFCGLSDQTLPLQQIFEVRYRHEISTEDKFKMVDGYANFIPIAKDQVLAHDKKGEVKTRINGRIFMPLYQPQGDDGFFVIRKVAKFWIKVSAILRKSGAWKILPVLPGVRKHKKLPNTLVLNMRIARFFGRQIFHLMGYRKRRKTRDTITYTRREFDLKSPDLP